MENSFKTQIDSAKSVLIMLPTRPYFDQVAAGLSLFLSLKTSKDVSVFSPTEMTVEFNRLVGVNKIAKELGNKNLVLKFTNYKANAIERVSYDIEDGEFRLTVIPKQGNNPPDRGSIDMGYSGVASDTVILIGGANESHFPSLSSKDFAGVKLLHVGIRQLNLGDKELISFARPSSSISELVAHLLKESGYQLDSDISSNVLMGIEEGSQNFTSQGTSADTFQLFADLMRAGGQRRPKEDERDFVTGSIPQIEDKPEESPKDWTGPKIYKGTTLS